MIKGFKLHLIKIGISIDEEKRKDFIDFTEDLLEAFNKIEKEK